MSSACVLYKAQMAMCKSSTMPPIRELCSGRLPQNAIICRARIDPFALFPATPATDLAWACPPNVPLFTTERGLESMSPGGGMNGNGKRGRNAGEDGMIPVIANLVSLPAADAGNKLIFVGISYNGGSRSRPVVSVAMGGQIPIPHESPEYSQLIGASGVWWKISDNHYGSEQNMKIAVPTANFDAGDRFKGPTERALCGITIQQASAVDCAVLLGVPNIAAAGAAAARG
tara:strand:- start:949 stop:1638 length:690 start_codon:yes stop_codon:yes gene_type:complete